MIDEVSLFSEKPGWFSTAAGIGWRKIRGRSWTSQTWFHLGKWFAPKRVDDDFKIF
jgi:hypothetical protein